MTRKGLDFHSGLTTMRIVEKEIPMANPPLGVQERSAVAKLTQADLGIIDRTILRKCSSRWLKVARVVCHADDALRSRYSKLSYVFYSQRLARLVELGRLESQGDVAYIRHSEVRLPAGSFEFIIHAAENGWP
jgi:hypothetical protein